MFEMRPTPYMKAKGSVGKVKGELKQINSEPTALMPMVSLLTVGALEHSRRSGLFQDSSGWSTDTRELE